MGLDAVLAAYRLERWNALIPKKAFAVTFEKTCVTYLHPTKGRRRVANKRLALPDLA